MPFIQKPITKNFINQVKSLVQTGKAGTEKEIAKKLVYNYSALNQIMNGKRNVPEKVYEKFTELYTPVEVKDEGVVTTIALHNQAINRVILRAVAELLSDKRKEAVTKTLGDLEAAVKVEIQIVSGKLQ
jgi:hypothetical protein